MRNSPRLMKAIAYVLTFTTTMTPLHGMAQESPEVDTQDFLSQLGREGQNLGVQLGNSAKGTPAKVENGQITIPTTDENGNLQYQGGSQFSVQSLYPGSNPSNSSVQSEYFSDGLAPDVDQLQGVYDSEENMGETGNDAKSSLWEDANSDTPSISGAAYKVLLDSSDLSRPDFSSDPMMALTNNTYENIDVIAEGFGDCSAETTLNEITMDVHNPEYETCDRVIKPSGDCKIRNNITTRNETADVYVAAKGNVWLTVEFDLKDGSWKTISPTDGLYFRAQIPTVDYDSVCKDADVSYSEFANAWDWTGHDIPGPIDSTVWYRSLQDPTCANGLVGRVQIQDTSGGDDPKYVLGGRFKYQFKSFKGNEWTTESCIDDAKKVNDGFCEGTLSITSGATNNSECINVNGIQICPGDEFANAMSGSPLSGIPKLATELQLSELKCDFNVGPMECWTDINGEEHCPVNSGENTNTCQEFEDNPQCGFISSDCVEGARGPSGACYVQEEIWDCGSSVSIDTVEQSTEYQCSGAIRCMGDDCLDPTATKSQTQNFAKASALLNAAQFMTQDMQCSEGATSEGGDENIDEGCTAFGGEPGECKIAVGGVSDCCEKPSNVSMADYLTMIRQVPKLDGAVLALEDGNVIKSSYQTLRQPVMDAWTEVSQPFTNYMDNISGAVEEIFSPIEELKNQLIEKLKEQAQSMLQDVMGNLAGDTATEAGATAAADQAAEEAMTEMASQAASMLGAAMTVYTVYVVAVAVIQMVYACEQEELEMNAKRATDSCTYVGSYCKSEVLGACVEKRKAYCCFNSPLSRIIQEQVRPQLGQTFGSAKEPMCGGIPLNRISEIDWSQVDLDEWLAILQQNGQMPDGSNLTMDALTGSGSVFNVDGDRQAADERAMDRVDDIDVDAKRREAMSKIDIDPRGNGGG